MVEYGADTPLVILKRMREGRVVEYGGRHPSHYIEKIGGGQDGRVRGWIPISLY